MANRIEPKPVYEATIEIDGQNISGYASSAHFDDETMVFICQFAQLPKRIRDDWRTHRPDEILDFRQVQFIVKEDELTLGERINPGMEWR